ncbi:hypothetical protein FHG87_020152 [Trinorchestia longiramus]|nr:hypothetical protein FHG87_020152 [Trinorchestia longiramus]
MRTGNEVSSWIAASGNDDLKTLSSSQIRFNRFICAKHFDASCFKEIFSPIKRRQGLKLGAIPRQYVESVECNEANTQVMLPTNTACLSSSVESPAKRMRINLPLTKIPISNYCEIPLKIPVNTPPRTLVQTSTEAPPKMS